MIWGRVGARFVRAWTSSWWFVHQARSLLRELAPKLTVECSQDLHGPTLHDSSQ